MYALNHNNLEGMLRFAAKMGISYEDALSIPGDNEILFTDYHEGRKTKYLYLVTRHGHELRMEESSPRRMAEALRKHRCADACYIAPRAEF